MSSALQVGARARGIDAAVLALVFALGAALYWPMFGIRPVENDNLYVLAWVDAFPLRALLARDPELYPEWRPLAYLTLWVEHRVVQLRAVALHYVVNLALWAVCAWLVHRLVFAISRSRPAGVAAALFVLTDPRATWTLVVMVDRQMSMACAFGLAALLAIVRTGEARLGRRQVAVAAALLVASALSKEYGLAFAVGVVAWGAVGRRLDVATAGIAAATAYGLLRLGLAGGAVRPYCEEMYFLFDLREQCVDPMRPAGLVQMAYNVAASAVDLTLHGLVSDEGRPVFAKQRLLTSGLLLVPMLVALVRGPRALRALALVAAANALLAFAIFRDRNQLAGAMALAAVSGAGIPLVLRTLHSRPVRIVAVAALAIGLVSQASLARRLVAEQAADLDRAEPCAWAFRHRPFAEKFVTRVKLHYGMDDPYCEQR